LIGGEISRNPASSFSVGVSLVFSGNAEKPPKKKIS
jgi:hypothetical protein